MNHEVRSEPNEYARIMAGEQTSVIRRNESPNFALSDSLTIREFNPNAAKFTDRLIMAEVTYVQQGDGVIVSNRYATISFRVKGQQP